MTDGKRGMAELAGTALVGGAIGGLLVWLLMRPSDEITEPKPDPDSAEVAAPTPPGDDPVPTVDADRVAALERKLATLERQVMTRQKLKAYADELQGGGGADANGSAPPPADPEDPAFELAVRSVLDKANYEREQEREQRREERREERVVRQVDYLADKLDLDDDQVAKVEEILLEQTEAFRALRDSDNRPVTRREWREAARNIRTQTTEKLGGVLSEEQFSAYGKLQEEEGFGRRGRRGRD
jgi:hypothetical protein